VEECRLVTDHSVLKMARQCHYLREALFRGCPHVTRRSYEALMQHCKLLDNVMVTGQRFESRVEALRVHHDVPTAVPAAANAVQAAAVTTGARAEGVSDASASSMEL